MTTPQRKSKEDHRDDMRELRRVRRQPQHTRITSMREGGRMQKFMNFWQIIRDVHGVGRPPGKANPKQVIHVNMMWDRIASKRKFVEA